MQSLAALEHTPKSKEDGPALIRNISGYFQSTLSKPSHKGFTNVRKLYFTLLLLLKMEVKTTVLLILQESQSNIFTTRNLTGCEMKVIVQATVHMHLSC